jgi:hypothetical protein
LQGNCREGTTQNEKDSIDNNLLVRSGKRVDPRPGEEIQDQSDSKTENRKGALSEKQITGIKLPPRKDREKL